MECETYYTGRSFNWYYQLRPFAALREVAGALRLRTQVASLSRAGFDKVKSAGRAEAPFAIRTVQDGKSIEVRARAVIDATGT